MRSSFREQQLDKVRSAAAAIEGPANEAPAYYFVGAAGFANQAVFAREVTSARAIVDMKLSTSGRSLLLVNDRRDFETHPLATTATLDATLTEISRKMRPDRDVLMLYLTSHGAPGAFSIQAPGLSISDLTPSELRQMLDRAGIRNRIVIISACYSGSFIEELEDPNTLIMTAARSDRTSFGCSDERHWTHFGNAYFNHGLIETIDPIAAFDKAKALILTWEREIGITQSEPQIVVGAAIRATLSQMTRDALHPSSPDAASGRAQADLQ